MKKARLFLMAALLIGMGSAFTTVKPEKLGPAYATLDNGENWIPIDTSQENDTFVCNSGSEFCYYASEDLGTGIGTQNKKYVELDK